MSEINYRRNGKKYGKRSCLTADLELPRKWQKNRKRRFNKKLRRKANMSLDVSLKINIIADPWFDSRY